MMGIPFKFNRVAAVFEEAAPKNRLCESSGSEHSPESSPDLSDLVNSFLEREVKEERHSEENDKETEIESESNCELKNDLKILFGHQEEDKITRNIHAEVVNACHEIGNSTSPDFKRRLMARLRDRGFDAGLCKSKWEKNGGCPAGNYEYIDAYIAGTRLVIEVYLAGEFTIARPTDHYTSLLEVFPPIFVCKVDMLKQVARLMCRAMRKSMKSTEIHLPPWRRLAYLQAKWFGSYKRTINEVSYQKAINLSNSSEHQFWKRSFGFAPVPVPGISYKYREDFGNGIDRRVGNLYSAIWPCKSKLT